MEKHNWIIAISGTDINGATLRLFTGTAKQVRNKILSMIADAYDNDSDNFDEDQSTLSADEMYDASGKGEEYMAWAVFRDYHLDYTAKRLDRIPAIIGGAV